MFRNSLLRANLTRSFNTWAAPCPKESLSTFLAIIPDFADSKRLAIRPQHIRDSSVGHANGWIISAGATFSNESREKMTGSWMLIRESSIEAVRERLSLDIYTTGGAWDMKNVKITAVAVAMHTSPI